MMDIHRILAGNPEHRRELIAAGIFGAVWFAIDVIQFGDWVVTKFSQTTIVTKFSAPPIEDGCPPASFNGSEAFDPATWERLSFDVAGRRQFWITHGGHAEGGWSCRIVSSEKIECFKL